jgi:multidrug efflux pump subunit AcrA (membrane-fusion protein)
MIRKNSIAHIALLISSGLLAGVLSGCGNGRRSEDAANAPTAPVVKVARRDLSNTLEIASEFQPLQEIEVYAKVSGYIKKLYIDWGTHVKEGQLLAVLEIPELQQQLQQDEAGARRSDQDLSRAREELNRAQSAYSVAHVTYTRLAGVQKGRGRN